MAKTFRVLFLIFSLWLLTACPDDEDPQVVTDAESEVTDTSADQTQEDGQQDATEADQVDEQLDDQTIDSVPDAPPPEVCSLPNPVRASLYDEVYEWVDVYTDGGFETGEAVVRIEEDSQHPGRPLATMTINADGARSGDNGVVIESGPGQGGFFNVLALVDKGVEVRYSLWVRSPVGPAAVRPIVIFENQGGNPIGATDNTIVGDPVPIAPDDGWVQVELIHHSTGNFSFASFGLMLQPNMVLHVDDVAIAPPMWQVPDIDGETRDVGGIQVPVEPIAPVHFSVLIHIEDPQELVRTETLFDRYATVFEELAAILDDHDGFLTIQPELELLLGAEAFSSDLISRLTSEYNVVYSTHTHGPKCVDGDGNPHGNQECDEHADEWTFEYEAADVIAYIGERVSQYTTAAGPQVSDHNGNWDFEDWSHFSNIGIRTLSAFKNGSTQSSFDTLFTNPWRPSHHSAVDDPEHFFDHNPSVSVIYLPGVGATVSKYDARVQEEVSRYAANFIALADPDRVNTFYIVTHVDHFFSLIEGMDPDDYIQTDEFQDHLDYWDQLFEELIDPLVAQGYLQWSSLPQMGDAFVAWEDRCAP